MLARLLVEGAALVSYVVHAALAVSETVPVLYVVGAVDVVVVVFGRGQL